MTAPSGFNRSFLLKLLGSLLSAGLLGILILWSWKDVLAALGKISLLAVLGAFVIILASRLFTVLRWHTLLRSAGIPIPLTGTLSLTFAGLFAGNFLPTTIGGDVVRLAGTIQMGYDRATCLASLAADRLINMAGMTLASPFGLLQVLQAAPGLQAAFLPGLWQKGFDFIRRALLSLGIWFKKPQSLFIAFGFTVAHILCSFATNALLIYALGGEIEFWRLAGLLSLGYFIGLIPVSINGYGWQELTASALLTSLGGLDISISATVTLLIRLLSIFGSLFGAFTLPAILSQMDKPEP